MKAKLVCQISIIIAAIGAINWATTALGFNAVSKAFGNKDYKDVWQSMMAPKDGHSPFFKYGTFEKMGYLLVGAAGMITLVCVAASFFQKSK